MGASLTQNLNGNLLSDGFCVLKDAVPQSAVQNALATFEREYMDSSEALDAQTTQIDRRRSVSRVGDRRYMMTVEMADGFGAPDLYANPAILETVEKALGPDYLIDNAGVVLALPGAEDQHVHRDHPGLFDRQFDRILPAYALTVVIPLVEMTDETGQTMLWPRTHRAAIQVDEVSASPHEADKVYPDLAPGDAVIWDYRLIHGGRGNRSQIPRPIIYLTYCRPWFQDQVNFRKKSKLLVGDGLLDTLPDARRALFRRAMW